MTDEGPPNKEVQKDLGNGVKVIADTSSHPFTVSTWDEGEKVTEDIAALQMEDMVWFAEGYHDAKERYQDDS